jgi:hypothetical protein
MRYVVLVTMFLAGLAVAGIDAQKAAAPELAGVLAEAASYIDGYAKSFGVIVCVERSQEMAAIGPGGRSVRSDVVMLGAPPANWLTFRDAFEVDGELLRPRDTRLVDALNGPAGMAIEAMKRINAEGGPQHMGASSVNRAMNAPPLALMFLARENQSRSDFTFDGMKSVDRLPAALVTFRERAQPRVLASANEEAAEGRFWIQPGTGRVLQTELSMKSRGRLPNSEFGSTVSAKITVRYAEQASLRLWLPAKLDEAYDIQSHAQQPIQGRPTGSTQTYSAHVDFSNYRKLDIDVLKFARSNSDAV